MNIQEVAMLEEKYALNSTADPHKGIEWLKQHSPIFAKMVEETKQRQYSELQYKSLLIQRPA